MRRRCEALLLLHKRKGHVHEVHVDVFQSQLLQRQLHELLDVRRPIAVMRQLKRIDLSAIKLKIQNFDIKIPKLLIVLIYIIASNFNIILLIFIDIIIYNNINGYYYYYIWFFKQFFT